MEQIHYRKYKYGEDAEAYAKATPKFENQSDIINKLHEVAEKFRESGKCA
ncbi:MAG: hypothetical protein NMK33_02245 [Candidatus Cardinium sp.]|nr:hypothetical protein [Cardinium endosymbiont of Dermatophagoides farinae]UWW97362.1 MAG: hypothetical protein NMK33_02245 [Candidatus Cardinium sp.]